MGIIKVNKFYIYLAVITGLIFLGTVQPVFSMIAFVVSLYFLVTEDRFEQILFLFFIMPTASIFKLSPSTTSFFTLLEIMFCIMYVIKNKFCIKEKQLIILLFGGFLAIIQLLNGDINIVSTIKLVTGIFILSIVTHYDIEKEHCRLFLVYIYGILISSILSFLNYTYNFLPLSNYVVFKDQKLGEDFITRFSGLAPDPNYYTVNIIISLCLICILFYKKEISIKCCTFLSVQLILFAAITLSKSALLMLVFPVFLFIKLCLDNKSWKSLSAIIIAILFFLYLVLSNHLNIFDNTLARLNNGLDFNVLTTGRGAIWCNYIEHMQEDFFHLIIGKGIFNVMLDGKVAHNTYIDILYQLGVIGTIFYSWIMYKIFTTNVKIKRNLLNYSIIITIIIMYMFLSELHFYDSIFHIILAYYALHLNFINNNWKEAV